MKRFGLMVAALSSLALAGCGETSNEQTPPALATTYQQPVPAASRLIAGHYRYLADAAVFTGCHTGQRWPVAGTAAAADLERAYLAARKAPGDSLVVSVMGHIEVLPGMEQGTELPQLVVDRVEAVPADIDCPLPSADLHGRKWQVLSIDGDTVSGDNPPWISFAEDGSVRGFAGCNRFTGSYRYRNPEMDFGPLATTKMACRDSANVEKSVLQALTGTTTATVEGQIMTLRGASGTLMTLEGVALP